MLTNGAAEILRRLQGNTEKPLEIGGKVVGSVPGHLGAIWDVSGVHFVCRRIC